MYSQVVVNLMGTTVVKQDNPLEACSIYLCN